MLLKTVVFFTMCSISIYINNIITPGSVPNMFNMECNTKADFLLYQRSNMSHLCETQQYLALEHAGFCIYNWLTNIALPQSLVMWQ